MGLNIKRKTPGCMHLGHRTLYCFKCFKMFNKIEYGQTHLQCGPVGPQNCFLMALSLSLVSHQYEVPKAIIEGPIAEIKLQEDLYISMKTKLIY